MSPKFAWLCICEVAADWMPRVPLLATRRFWLWAMGSLVCSIIAFRFGLQAVAGRPAPFVDVVLLAITLSIPVVTVGLIIQARAARVPPRVVRGFEIVSGQRSAEVDNKALPQVASSSSVKQKPKD